MFLATKMGPSERILGHRKEFSGSEAIAGIGKSFSVNRKNYRVSDIVFMFSDIVFMFCTFVSKNSVPAQNFVVGHRLQLLDEAMVSVQVSFLSNSDFHI